MEGEERIEERLEGEAAVVEGDFDDFCVSGAISTDFFVCRVFEATACVSYGGVDDTS